MLLRHNIATILVSSVFSDIKSYPLLIFLKHYIATIDLQKKCTAQLCKSKAIDLLVIVLALNTYSFVGSFQIIKASHFFNLYITLQH